MNNVDSNERGTADAGLRLPVFLAQLPGAPDHERWAVRFLPLIFVICLLSGCASDSSSRSSLPARYQGIHAGMSRDEVYKLLGKPHGGYCQGAKDVVTEVWVDRLHGQANRLCVLFGSDGRARHVDQDTVVMP